MNIDKKLKKFDEIFPELYEPYDNTWIKDVTKKVRFFLRQALEEQKQEYEEKIDDLEIALAGEQSDNSKLLMM